MRTPFVALASRVGQFARVLLCFVVACGGAESSSVLADDATPPSASLPNLSGTCILTLDEPSGTRTLVLPGYAAMRGDRLRVHCTADGRDLRVTFGDPAYRGPGDYVVDRDRSGGSVSLYDGDLHYSSSASAYATTACRLSITDGPAAAAQPGDRIRGTMTCVDMEIERGLFNSVLVGRAQLRDGAFDATVP
jgi:hypothetical protein